MPELVNLGSFCIDYVYSVPSIVRAGETLLGTAPVRHAGGKGLNQSLGGGTRGRARGAFWLRGHRRYLAEGSADARGRRRGRRARLRNAANRTRDDPGLPARRERNRHRRRRESIDSTRRRRLVRSRASVATAGLLLQNEINDVDDVLARSATRRDSRCVQHRAGRRPRVGLSASTRSSCCC